ncbi:MAG: hypothetical protein ABII07_01045 [Patescibacteria group bacterium]|nr:hypothetical protein [Patescibacteria group bacterium]
METPADCDKRATAWEAEVAKIQAYCSTLPDNLSHHVASDLMSNSDVEPYHPPGMESIVDGSVVDYEQWVTRSKIVLERYKAKYPGEHIMFALMAYDGLSFMRTVDNPAPHLFWEESLVSGSTPTKLYVPGKDDQFWGEINRQFVSSRMERRAN